MTKGNTIHVAKEVSCTMQCKCAKCGKSGSAPGCTITAGAGNHAGQVMVHIPEGEWEFLDDCGCTETVSEFTQTLLKFHEWLRGIDEGITIGSSTKDNSITTAIIRRYAVEFLR